MCTPNRFVAVALALGVAGSAAFAETPNLGRLATPEEVAAWDISIGPDGTRLPTGGGTPQQGEAVYVAKCLGCHGQKGAGKPNDQLVGGRGTLVGDQAPVKTVGSFWPYATTLFDYVRRAMPLNKSSTSTARLPPAWARNECAMVIPNAIGSNTGRSATNAKAVITTTRSPVFARP